MNNLNRLGALVLATVATVGCVDDSSSEANIPQQTTEDIRGQLANFCYDSNVGGLVCNLSQGGRDVATLSLDCRSDEGEKWASSPEELGYSYDTLNWRRDCVIEATQY